MHKEKEGVTVKEGEKVRRCEKAETGMQLRGRRGPNEELAKASRLGMGERKREKERDGSDGGQRERRKNGGDEETRMP